MARSSLVFGITGLAPLILVQHYGVAPRAAGALDVVFLFFGAVGTVLGGPFSDRYGRRLHLLLAFALTVPAVILMPHLPFYGFLLAMAVTGFFTVSTFSTTVTLTQEILPRNVGVAGGLAAGFGVGAGGLVLLILGHLADRLGLLPVASAFFVLPVLSFLFALPLSPRRIAAA